MAADKVPSDDWLMSGTAAPSEVAEHYDAWADSYDTDLDSWSYQAPAAAAKILLALDPRPESVVDVGCGTGLVGKALRARGYRGRLVGVDISSVSLALAQESGTYDDVRQADLQQPLPLDDDAADALVCVGVMTYLADTERVWREFARVARRHVVVTQREDLWDARHCREVVERLASDGAWSPLEVQGPAPYLPDATGSLAGLGCYYVVARVGSS
jgi:ubiquinone/menaquinone biosynthesis C-methylase UbiE